jgi:hypothetical protein
MEGVAVSWRPPQVPRGPQDDRGRARWVYDFTAYNPGQLPISDVRIEVHFALDVERFHGDGTVEEPTRMVILETPVLAGGKERTWSRNLQMNYEDSVEALPQTSAVISFIDPENPHRRQENSWPKHAQQADVQSN